MAYRIGQWVEWDWGNGTPQAQVVDRHPERVTLDVGGSEIVRNGTPDNPAYRLRQQDGQALLKLESELRPAA